MTEPSITPPSDVRTAMGRTLRGLPFVLLGTFSLVSLLIGAGIAYGIASYFSPPPPPPPPANITVVRPTPQVIVAVRELARLEGAEYHMERVVDVRDQQSRFFGLVHSEDAILLVAAGDVTAGVDLAALRDGDVVVDTEKLEATIVLPRAQVLSTRLDNEHTYVHTRQTDTLAARHEDLETRARQEAERTLEQAALSGGILERAQRNAEHTVDSLVRSLGYTKVSVRTRRPEE